MMALFQEGDLLHSCMSLSEALCVLLASLPTGVPAKQKMSLALQRLDLLTYLKVSAFVFRPGSEYFVLGSMTIFVAPPTKVLLHRLIIHVSPMLSVILTPSQCFLTSILTLSWLLTPSHSLCWQFPWSPALGHPRVPFIS